MTFHCFRGSSHNGIVTVAGSRAASGDFGCRGPLDVLVVRVPAAHAVVPAPWREMLCGWADGLPCHNIAAPMESGGMRPGPPTARQL
jgi:hypothetical protein